MSSDDRDLLSRRQALKALAAATVCPLLINCEFVDVFDDDFVTESTFSLSDPGLEVLEEVGGHACYDHGPRPIILVRVSEDEILGFDQICPHQDLNLGQCSGETSNALWDQDQQQLTCPWHNSVFDRDGDVVAGPAPEAIRTYRVEFDPDSGQGTVFTN